MLHAAVKVLLFVKRELHDERATLHLIDFSKNAVVNIS
jgi:hypothetical protein